MSLRKNVPQYLIVKTDQSAPFALTGAVLGDVMAWHPLTSGPGDVPHGSRAHPEQGANPMNDLMTRIQKMVVDQLDIETDRLERIRPVSPL